MEKPTYTTVSAHVSQDVKDALIRAQEQAGARSLSAFLGGVLTKVVDAAEDAREAVAAEAEAQARIDAEREGLSSRSA